MSSLEGMSREELKELADRVIAAYVDDDGDGLVQWMVESERQRPGFFDDLERLLAPNPPPGPSLSGIGPD